jgi:uncharacterized membrane-anchored protein
MTKAARIRLAVLGGLFGLATGQASAASKAGAETSPQQPASGQATHQSGRDEETIQLLNSVQWTVGPARAAIGRVAEIRLPDGVRFTGGEGARALLEMLHDPIDGHELGLLTNDTLDWLVVFAYEAVGYVKDADKQRLDAAAILESLRKGNRAGNQERKRRGWPPLTIQGWHTPPSYDKDTNSLEWCIEGSADGRHVVNCSTRMLGRAGVMSANLLVVPEALEATLPRVKTVLRGFSYRQGQKYSEWKSGDKTARCGLSTLVVGGAMGLAVKMGLLARIAASIAKLWKVVIVGLLGALIALKGFIFGNEQKPPTDKQA